DSKPAQVVVTVTATPSESAAADEGEDAADPEESESVDPVVPATAAIGDTVRVGDWDITITDLVLNANEMVRAANEFNETPRGQYVVVTYEGVYRGSQRTADITELTWQFTTSDNRLLES